MSKLEDLKKILEEAKDDKGIKEYLENLNPVDSAKVEKFLKTDDGKKFHQPILDAYHTKSLETWQKNNLQKIKDDAIAASKNETPEQKQIREISEKLNASEIARKKEAIRNKALQELQSKALPVELIDLISTAETEDGVIANVSKVADVFKSQSEKLNAEFQTKNGRNVVKPGQTKLTFEALKTMTKEQVAQFSNDEINAALAQAPT